MKETMAVLDTRPNSFSPINGTTVLSKPTIIPTNMLIKTRSENWPMFSRRPNLISLDVLRASVAEFNGFMRALPGKSSNTSS
jgi:hypothetical protein